MVFLKKKIVSKRALVQILASCHTERGDKILCFRPQICPLGLKPVPQASKLLFWNNFCHPYYKSASGRLEINPTTSLDYYKQGIGYR